MARPPINLADPDSATSALQDLLGRAVLLTEQSNEKQDVQITATTLLLAFLAAKDPLSVWFQEYVDRAGIDRRAMLATRAIHPDAFLNIRESDAPQVDLEAIEVSYSVGELLRQAEDLRNRTSGRSYLSRRLDVRHVMGAYIYAPGSHAEQLAGWGFVQEDWSTDFLVNLVLLYPARGGELQLWRTEHIRAFGEPPPESLPSSPAERLIDYDADRAAGGLAHDLLNITPDVNALAALIAAKNTLPSLAIGVFGDWGAGKTFFMRSLILRVDELSAAARGESTGLGETPQPEQLQREITFYKRIVQIEFNAWHYVEGNLWASLVEHIFSSLRSSQDPNWDPDGNQTDRLEHLLKQIEGAKQAQLEAEQEVKDARAALAEAAGELARLEREREKKQRELADLTVWDVLQDQDRTELVAQVNGALVAAGLPQVAGGLDEMQAALAEGRALLQRGGAFFAPLLRAESQERNKRWRMLIAALVAGPLIVLLGSLVAWWAALPESQALFARIASVASGVAAFLGAASTWLRAQVRWSSGQLSKLEAANKALEEKQKAKLEAYDAQIKTLEGEVAGLDKDYATAQEQAEAARRHVQELEERRRRFQPAQRLARFIEDRTDSDDYRKHLGLLALVRRDFQQLSDYIEGQNAWLDGLKDLAEEQKDANQRINRIVLYIDDLDRCPADKVVQVLQAVHLLLAFPLFVVVVGVDARWVSRSLEERYPHLKRANQAAGADGDPLGFGHDATPHDYLEKIFQIPVWLYPIDARGTQQMLDGLLAGRIAEAEKNRPPDLVSDQPLGEPPDRPPDQPPEELSEEEQPREQPEGQPEERRPTPPPIDLTPQSLEIVAGELAFMKALAPIVGRSPRAIKRYVNLYRLIKATLEQTETPLRIEPVAPGGLPADHAVVLLLLGVVTGLPEISRRFFDAIQDGQESNEAHPDTDPLPAPNLEWALNQVGEPNRPAAAADLKRLRAWLAAYHNGAWLDAPLSCFADRAAQVARYSFRVEQRAE